MTKEEYDRHIEWMMERRNREYPQTWTPTPVLDPELYDKYERITGRPLAPVMIPTMNEKKDTNEKQIGGRHYKRLKIQVWDYIIANDLDYFQGSITKYVTRWKDKGGIEDLHKAKHFLDKYIVTMEEKFKDMKERPDGKEDPKET